MTPLCTDNTQMSSKKPSGSTCFEPVKPGECLHHNEGIPLHPYSFKIPFIKKEVDSTSVCKLVQLSLHCTLKYHIGTRGYKARLVRQHKKLNISFTPLDSFKCISKASKGVLFELCLPFNKKAFIIL